MNIEACPVCRYSLQGLSEPLRCPECGLRLGIEPLLFRPSGNAWLIFALLAAVVSIGVLLLLWTNGSDPVLYWWVAILAFQSLGPLFCWRRARLRFMIVSAKEVRIFQNNIETTVVPLDTHTDARWDWTTGRITFQRFGTETGASFGPQSGRIAREILQSIEGRIGRATPSQET